MLRFEQTPDVVFVEILKTSIPYAIDNVKQIIEMSNGDKDQEADLLEELYPNASKVFDCGDALIVLRDFQEALKSKDYYYLNDYHYLLLYDVLEAFSRDHNGINDLNEEDKVEMRPIGKYKIDSIDFDSLVEMYFWDTDFLLDENDASFLGPEVFKSVFGMNEETFDLSQGKPITDDLMKLTVYKKDGEYEPVESKVFGPDSHVYPDLECIEEEEAVVM